MVGLENLPMPALELVMRELNFASMCNLISVSRRMNELGTHPTLWEHIWDNFGESMWKDDPGRMTSLLGLGRFSEVKRVRIVSDRAVEGTLWEELTEVIVRRGDTRDIGITISANLDGLSSTLLGRLLRACHCVEWGNCEGVSDHHRDMVLSCLGSMTSSIRHVQLKGMGFGDDAGTSYFLRMAASRTWSLKLGVGCCTAEQQADIRAVTPGSGREGPVPASGCNLQDCTQTYMLEVANHNAVAMDFNAFWDELLGQD